MCLLSIVRSSLLARRSFPTSVVIWLVCVSLAFPVVVVRSRGMLISLILLSVVLYLVVNCLSCVCGVMKIGVMSFAWVVISVSLSDGWL